MGKSLMIAALAFWLATGSPLWALADREPDRTSDIMSDCRPAIQKRIAELLTIYGDFHFTCRHGFLWKIYAAPGSVLYSVTRDSIPLTYWDLFLPSPPKPPLKFTSGRGVFQQLFGGVPISGTYADWEDQILLQDRTNDQILGDQFVRLSFNIVDTSAWGFDTTIKLNCEQAIRAAQEYAKKQGIAIGWDYRCDSNSAEIYRESCFGVPRADWHVRARKSERPDSRGFTKNHSGPPDLGKIFVVDPNSGRVCTFDKPRKG